MTDDNLFGKEPGRTRTLEKKRKYTTMLYPQLTRFRLFTKVILTYNVSNYRLDTLNESSALLAPVADPAGVVSVEVMRNKGSLTYDFHLPSGNSVAVTGLSGKKSLVLKAGCNMAIKTRSTKRNFCSSGEGSNSDLPDDALSGASFGERWSDHTDDLQKVASSLEKEGLIRDEHLEELKGVGSALAHTEIPDLDEVVKETARVRIEKYGSDPVAVRVQDVLSNLDVARNAAHFLQNEVEHLDKQAKKRMLPGEGEARASQLSQILNCDIIPAINNVIVSYKDLREAAVPFESDSADNSMDSDADSGGGDGEE